MNLPVIIFVRGRAARINRWQSSLFTEKVIQQLQEEPKVILSAYKCSESDSVSHRSPERSDHSVPDLSDIANYVECSSCEQEDIIDTEQTMSDSDIETEMCKIFETSDECTVNKFNINEHDGRRRKSRKKEDIRALIIRLFGSPLDDIKVHRNSAQKVYKNRRQTLPISINLPDGDFLKPLKICNKRKSNDDTHLSPNKASRREVVQAITCQLPEVTFTHRIEEIPEVIQEKIAATVTMTSEKVNIIIMTKPKIVEAKDVEIVKVSNTKSSEIIDLTKETYVLADQSISLPKNKTMVLENGIKIEILSPPTCSEKENAPAVSASMPSLPQETPNDSSLNQSEKSPPNVRLEADPSVQRSTPKRSVLQEIMQQCSAQQQALQSQKSQQQQTVAGQKVQHRISPSGGGCLCAAEVPVQSQSISNNNNQQQSSTVNLMKQRPLLPKHSTTQRQSSVIQQTSQHLPATMSNQAPPNVTIQSSVITNRQNQTIQTMTSNCRQNWNQRQIQKSNPPPPQTPQLRPFKPNNSTYSLLSNAALIEKLFPHFYMYMQWKEGATIFYHNIQTLMSQGGYKEHYKAFLTYINQMTAALGKKLIMDLMTIDVDNFNLNQILLQLSAKLQEKNLLFGVYRICLDFFAMLKPCKCNCITPFTQKLYRHISMAVARIETRSQTQVTSQQLFTLYQLKQLEFQIKQYLMIRSWTGAFLMRHVARNSNNSKQSQNYRPVAQGPRSQKNQKTSQPESRPNEQITLKNLLQSSNNPDRSGRSDNPNLATQVNVNSVSRESSIISQNNMLDTNRGVPIQKISLSLYNRVDASASTSPEGNKSTVPLATSSGSVAAEGVRGSRTEIDEVVDLCEMTEEKVKVEEKKVDDEIIDLTWIDDCDEATLLEEVKECKVFPFKVEGRNENETVASGREVVSPADSGLGSPRGQDDNSDGFRCLCGNKAMYVCACNTSMYCGKECQINDWADHQRWCQELHS